MNGNPIWGKRETAETLRLRCPTSVAFLRELAGCMSGFCDLSRDRMAEAADEIERLQAGLRHTRELMCPITGEHELIGPEQYADEMMEYDAETDRLCGDSPTRRSHGDYIKLWHEYNDWRETEFDKAAEAEEE
jgi:hypothetical protein